MDALPRILRNFFLRDDGLRGFVEVAKPKLPIVVRPITSNRELLEVAKLRLRAFRSPSETEEQISKAIDPLDYSAHSLVYCAFESDSNKPLGTMRVTFGNRGPTVIPALTTLPTQWQIPCGEARMLCVPRNKYTQLVITSLCKAFFLSCRAEQLDYILIGSRRAMEPFYRILRFEDIDPAIPQIFTLPGTTVEHRILALKVSELDRIWAQPPHDIELLRTFFLGQTHEEIVVPNEAGGINPLHGLPEPVLNGTQIPITAANYLTR